MPMEFDRTRLIADLKACLSNTRESLTTESNPTWRSYLQGQRDAFAWVLDSYDAGRYHVMNGDETVTRPGYPRYEPRSQAVPEN